MKKSLLSQLENKISLEMVVSFTLTMYLIQELVFYNILSGDIFYVSVLLTFLGLILGLLSTSFMLLSSSIIVIFLGAFLLFFEPIIMPTNFKLFLIVVIPVYATIAYYMKKSVYIRKLLSFREDDIRGYLKYRDPLTGYRTVESFFSKYPEFISSLSNVNHADSRVVVASLFYLDFYDQYFYRSKESTDQLIRDMGKVLLDERNPEELFFYMKKGAFVVLSIIYDNEQERKSILDRNKITKESLNTLLFKTNIVQGITIRQSECFITRKTTLTADQVLHYLYRRAETDLAIEYI